MARNVHKDEVSSISLPSVAISEDRGLDLCNEPFPVLADISDTSYYKNDRTGIAGLFDSITVYLVDEAGNEELAPGTAVNFPVHSDPEKPNAAGFIIDWRQYTEAPGGVVRLKSGCYKVKVEFTVSGITDSYFWGSYRLLPYTINNAAGTSRIFVVLNDYVRTTGINYKNSGFATTFRFRGKFGYRQPNYDMENITEINRTTYKLRNESINTYELRTEPLLSCFTDNIDTNHLLVASQIYLSDHNADSHKQYFDLPVILDEEKSPEMEYPGGRKATITAFFKDKVKKRESKYDGDLAGSSNLILELPQGVTASGCQPVDISINTNEVTDTIPSGGSKNYNLLDQNGDTVTVDSVSGDDVTLNAEAVNPDAVLIKVRTYETGTSNDDQFTIQTNTGSFSYNYNVDWGDGLTDTNVTGDITHTFANGAGTYDIVITENIPNGFPKFFYNGVGDKDKLIEVSQTGGIFNANQSFAFDRCGNLDFTATDLVELSNTTRMFADNTSLRGNNTFNNIDTSSSTTLGSMFGGATFDKDISGWNVSNVTTARFFLFNNSEFNHNLGTWQINSFSDITAIFKNSGMSTANYTDTIVGWANFVFNNGGTPSTVNMSDQAGMTFDTTRGGGANFATAGDARNYLTTTLSWTITNDTII